MVYEARYGFNPKTVAVLLVSAVFVATALLIPDGSIVMRVGTLVLFGGGGVLMLVNSLSRKPAFRVDQSGITLGGPPMRYEAATQRVPWSDIEAVVLWRQHSAANLPWIGVLRHPDAPPLHLAPSSGTGRAMLSTASALSGAPDRRLMQCARAMSGWKVDTDRLTDALRTFAPQVRLIDNR